MKLWQWPSRALKAYGDGHAIAIAPTIDTARERIMAAGEAYFLKRYPWRDPADSDDATALAEFRRQLAADLSVDVVPVAAQAILIEGSE